MSHAILFSLTRLCETRGDVWKIYAKISKTHNRYFTHKRQVLIVLYTKKLSTIFPRERVQALSQTFWIIPFILAVSVHNQEHKLWSPNHVNWPGLTTILEVYKLWIFLLFLDRRTCLNLQHIPEIHFLFRKYTYIYEINSTYIQRKNVGNVTSISWTKISI